MIERQHNDDIDTYSEIAQPSHIVLLNGAHGHVHTLKGMLMGS
jgi:hypothetical protein